MGESVFVCLFVHGGGGGGGGGRKGELCETDLLFAMRSHNRPSVVCPLQTRSRDHDAREYYKTRRQQRTIADHLRTQEGEEGEQKKRLRELEGQLRDFAEAYEVVKAERNKTHAQIQVSGGCTVRSVEGTL